MCSKQKKTKRHNIEDDNMNDAIRWDGMKWAYM